MQYDVKRDIFYILKLNVTDLCVAKLTHGIFWLFTVLNRKKVRKQYIPLISRIPHELKWWLNVSLDVDTFICLHDPYSKNITGSNFISWMPGRISWIYYH